MKTAHIAAVGIIAISIALAGAPKRVWETGTLIDSAEEYRSTGSGPVAIAKASSGQSSNPALDAAGDFATAAAIAANGPRSYTLQGFVIRGDKYAFMVKRVMGRHNPNVTIRGPIRYAMENGKFYILDDDGKVFQLVVMKKELLPPSPPSPEAQRDRAFRQWLDQKVKDQSHRDADGSDQR